MASAYVGDYNYLRDVLDINPLKNKERFEACLRAMQKYSTPWWHDLRDDLKALIAMQLKEPNLLIPCRQFKKGLSIVLERPIKDSELYFANEALKKEFAEKA